MSKRICAILAIIISIALSMYVHYDEQEGGDEEWQQPQVEQSVEKKDILQADNKIVDQVEKSVKDTSGIKKYEDKTSDLVENKKVVNQKIEKAVDSLSTKTKDKK